MRTMIAVTERMRVRLIASLACLFFFGSSGELVRAATGAAETPPEATGVQLDLIRAIGNRNEADFEEALGRGADPGSVAA